LSYRSNKQTYKWQSKQYPCQKWQRWYLAVNTWLLQQQLLISCTV